MVFILKPDKSVNTIPEHVNVGETAASIVLVSPFSGVQTAEIRYRLPDGREGKSAFLKHVGFQEMRLSVYQMDIRPELTAMPGEVSLHFVLTDAGGREFVSDECSFPVGGFSALPFPDDKEQGSDFAALLKALLASASASVEESRQHMENAREAMEEAEQSERSAAQSAADAKDLADQVKVITSTLELKENFEERVGEEGWKRERGIRIDPTGIKAAESKNEFLTDTSIDWSDPDTTWFEINVREKTVRKHGSPVLTMALGDERYAINTYEAMAAIVGMATEQKAGLMSATDKMAVETLKSILGENADTVINTIEEVFRAFESYPEGANVAAALADKVSKRTEQKILYGVNGAGDQAAIPYDSVNTPGAALVRDEGGRAKISDPIDEDDIVNKRYHSQQIAAVERLAAEAQKDAIDAKRNASESKEAAEASAAVASRMGSTVTRNGKDIANIKELVNVKTALDVGNFGSKTVPANSLRQAKLLRVGGMTRKTNNLIPFPYYSTSKTEFGVTWSITDDRKVTANGTKTTGETNFTFASRMPLPSGSYCFSGLQTSGASTSSFYIGADIYSASGSWSRMATDSGNGAKFTLTAGETVTVFVKLASTYTGTVNITVLPMLNVGDTALPYEPYFVGLRSAKVTAIKSVGQNLIKFPYNSGAVGESVTVNGVTTTVNADGSIKRFGTASGISSFSFSTTADFEHGVTYSASNGVIVSYVTPNGTQYATGSFTWDNSYQLVNIYTQASSGATVDRVIYPMINEGATVKPYTPYTECTVQIPEAVQALDGYGLGTNESHYNYIEWRPDEGVKEWHKTQDIVDLGTLDWTMMTDSSYAYSARFAKLNGSTTFGALPPSVTRAYIDQYGAFVLIFTQGAYTSAAELKAALSGCFCVYDIASPEVTDISHLLDDDNFIEVEGNGRMTAETGNNIFAPLIIEYTVRESYDRKAVVDLIGEATSSLAGLMSAADKQKLAAISSLLNSEGDGSLLEQINNVLEIFSEYPEGITIIEKFAALEQSLQRANADILAADEKAGSALAAVGKAEVAANEAKALSQSAVVTASEASLVAGDAMAATDEKIGKKDRALVVALIGEATAGLSGLMSAADKAQLATLTALLANDDSDTVVNTIAEVLRIFQQYPEGASIAQKFTDIAASIDAQNTAIETANNNASQAIAAAGDAEKDAEEAKDLAQAAVVASGETSRMLEEYKNNVYTRLEEKLQKDRAAAVELIGTASKEMTGLMSAADKALLVTLATLLGNDTTDGNTVVNTIREVLATFESYPEGVSIASALAAKVNKLADALSLYATNAEGILIPLAYTESATPHSIPIRDVAGQFKIGAPTEQEHPVRMRELDPVKTDATNALSYSLSAMQEAARVKERLLALEQAFAQISTQRIVSFASSMAESGYAPITFKVNGVEMGDVATYAESGMGLRLESGDMIRFECKRSFYAGVSTEIPMLEFDVLSGEGSSPLLFSYTESSDGGTTHRSYYLDISVDGSYQFLTVSH